ncbi:small lysine-rich protein 1 isoform X1 [Meleagris gallopavo]|uniref:small lysine-rich protein 1 isoform X1 n=1 Tax=Meleagris gallopavo TaxID=9103 RepID=UPI0012AB4224|nr:small lysine-rich protein 1 isoform X1 [Meleagris gallopavo]
MRGVRAGLVTHPFSLRMHSLRYWACWDFRLPLRMRELRGWACLDFRLLTRMREIGEAWRVPWQRVAEGWEGPASGLGVECCLLERLSHG